MRTAPKPEALDAMLKEHLSFEINRFKFGVRAWNHRPHFENHELICESCLIHARLLLDFIFRRGAAVEKSQFNDIFLVDYLQQPNWPESLKDLLEEKGQTPGWVAPFRERLNWLLAHLTMDRFDRTGFDFEPKLRALDAAIDQFLAALPPERRALYDPTRGIKRLSQVT